MRKMLTASILAGAMMLAPMLTSPAQASQGWLSIGTAFRVGAAHISFVFGSPGYGYDPAYYYRYDQPIRYSGHSCSRYCYHEGAYDYHHESCPLVAAHFSNYRVDPRWAFDRYAPRYDGYGYRSYGNYGYRDHRYDGDRRDRRYDRYDRDDRHDRDGRYDRYDRNDRYDRGDRRYDRDDHRDRRGHDRRDRGRDDHRRHGGRGH